MILGIVYVIGSGKLCVKGKMYKFVGVERYSHETNQIKSRGHPEL